MKHFVMILVFLSTVVLDHCQLADEEAQELCPVKCACEEKAKDRIIANCSKQNYTSIRPRFPKLYSLNFSHNQISEVRNINFKDANFHDIQCIDLSNNLIRNIETKSFEHLTQLRHLNLSSNEIKSASPELFKKLRKLDTLDLRGNSIDCIPLKNELPWVNILCSGSEEYAYDSTVATAAPTKASDSNMEIPKISYKDDTTVTTVTLSRKENSTIIQRHFDSETVTKTNMNDTEVQITTNTKNYNSTVFGVTQITHEVATDQQSSTVPAINEDKSAAQIIVIILVLSIIGVCVGMFFWHRKCKYTKVPTDPEGQHQDESNDKMSLCHSPCFSTFCQSPR